MDSEEKRIINSLILELRALMEEELELVLKHYGIFLNRKWLDIKQLDYLSDEEKQTKKKLETYIKRKEKIGINKEESAKEFITEATYHWLNRIFGLKCLESRKLIQEIITTRSDYSGRSLIHRNYIEEHPDLKKNEDEGYFQCLYESLSKLTSEIQIIFDPKDIHMLIKPRFNVLKEIIKRINNLDEKIYQNDEFLGWIYQYFHDKEREKIYRRVKDEKLKIGGSNLIPLTQLYTEDYMVKFLAQNSLGSIWMEMYPRSFLFKNWEYYVNSPNNERREINNLSEIKILDPACGSGHFLVYLYEMLYEMYIEEGKVAVKDIPRVIIEKNLFGIDIDTRAIQITALILYIKYKEKVVDETVEIPNFNLFSSDIISYKTEILNDFLNEFENNKFLKKIIVAIWSNLEDIKEIGSLSQIDQIINRLIDEEIESNHEGILRFTGSRIENWHSFRIEIINRLKYFLQDAIQTFDINRELFAKDKEKGLWLIDTFENKYDMVITNPPYMGSIKLTPKLKKIFKKLYPLSNRNLYTMFIEKNINFLKENGILAMITMENFMFTNSYKNFRNYLLNNIKIKKLIHFGKDAFLEMGDHVPAVMFIFYKNDDKNNNATYGIYYNLQNIQTREKKKKELINNEYCTLVNQENFRYLENYPFIHWVSEAIINLFRDNISLEKISPAKQGMATSDNERFLKFWWEIKKTHLANINSEEKKKWHFYAKGGIYNKWYGNLHYVVNWEENGREIRNFDKAVIRNPNFYFRQGITYTSINSKFNSRFLPMNCLFDSKGSCVFPINHSDIYYILGFLNSSLVGYFLNFLNPTVDTQVGDINRLPYIKPNEVIRNNISVLVKKAIKHKIKLLSFDISEWEFKQTGIEYAIDIKRDVFNLQKLYKIYSQYRDSLILKIILTEAIIEQKIIGLYDITEEDKEKINNDQGFIPGFLPIITNFEKLPNNFDVELENFYSKVKNEEIDSLKLEKLGNKIKEIYEKENPSQVLDFLSYISLKFKINPISVFNIISELDLINESDFKFESENFLTKIILDTLHEELSGIILLDEPSADEILFKRILKRFDNIFGEKNTDNIVKQINNLFGKSIDDWIEKVFFKRHISQFKKRPIIWHLSSEEKSFQCFIDYHKLSQNLLLILRNRFVEKRLTFLKEESKHITESLKNESNDSNIKEYNKKYIEIEDSIDDLQKFSENLKKIIDMNIEFNEDNGVKQQILPFQKNSLLAINKVI